MRKEEMIRMVGSGRDKDLMNGRNRLMNGRREETIRLGGAEINPLAYASELEQLFAQDARLRSADLEMLIVRQRHDVRPAG